MGFFDKLFGNIIINLDDSEFGDYLFKKYAPPTEEEILKIKEEIEGPQEEIVTEEPEKEEVKENDETVNSDEETEKEEVKESYPAFTINDYVFDADGTVRLRDSSSKDVIKETIPDTGLANIVMNNGVIKELIPELKAEDIFVENHMLLMKVRRDVDEIYRIDILGDNILVQAPTETTFQDLDSGEEYNFVAVPIDTELGKTILTTKDYKIKATDSICVKDSIFRLYQNAA